MGINCSCSNFEDKNENVLDIVTQRNQQIDEKILPESNCIKLKYLNNFQEEFNVLKYISLANFINLLNSFKLKHNCKETTSDTLIFKEAQINKDDWITFIDYKICHNPLIPKMDSLIIPLHKQLFDDIFDKLLFCYKFFYRKESKYIPKIMIISYAFNHCGRKLSQKIDIFLNLFSNEENMIDFNNELYSFFFCLVIFAFDFPTEYLCKYWEEENAKYFNISSPNDYKKYSCGIRREKIFKNFFLTDNKLFFGDDESRVYTIDEFRKLLLDNSPNGFSWILDNDLIRSKIEEGLTD